jgi:hypothetical protein
VCPAVDVGKIVRRRQGIKVLVEYLVFATRDFPKCTLSRAPASDGAFDKVCRLVMYYVPSYLGRCTDYLVLSYGTDGSPFLDQLSAVEIGNAIRHRRHQRLYWIRAKSKAIGEAPSLLFYYNDSRLMHPVYSYFKPIKPNTKKQYEGNSKNRLLGDLEGNH